MSQLDQEICFRDDFTEATVGELLAWLDSLSPEDRARALKAKLSYDGGCGRSDNLSWIPAGHGESDRVNINW